MAAPCPLRRGAGVLHSAREECTDPSSIMGHPPSVVRHPSPVRRPSGGGWAGHKGGR